MFDRKSYRKKYYLDNITREKLLSHALYLKNKESVLKRHKKYYSRRVRLVNREKDKPCMDCGISYPTCIMQFDHRPGELKLGTINNLARRSGSIKNIKDEMRKCDIVCANCHSWRTFSRRMGRLEQ